MKTKSPIAIATYRMILLAFLLSATLPAVAQTSALRTNGKIALTRQSDGNPEIYLVNPDSTGLVRLTYNTVVDDAPAWSPDGTRIAFISQWEDGTFGIFTMNADGSNRTPVTLLSLSKSYNPGWWWSPLRLSWSPDGKKIAFNDSGDIFVVNVDGSGKQNLTPDPTEGATPAWSPDGSKILFARSGFLCTINADGTNLTPLQNGGADASYEIFPDWSAASNKIVYSANRWDYMDLYIANPDGTGRQFLHGCDFNPACGLDSLTPTFSPDGTKIAFTMGTNGAYAIYVKDIATGATWLTAGGTSPSWQPLPPAGCASFNPIDCPDFFISQQYRDFLGREPESCPPNQCGLDFYLPILQRAGNNAEWVRYTRGVVSANFFRSPEFGRKGAYVVNLFNIVMGQRPKTVAELSDPSKVERPHYAEFTADLASVSTPNDDPLLTDQKKDQLAVDWLTRGEAQAILPNSLTNQQFVQKLETNAGVTLSNENALIANLNGGALTRAQVLRAVAESPEVVSRFDISNFVTMEYFGYLRRDPEDCHDPANWGGMDPNQCGFIFHNQRFLLSTDEPFIQNIIVRGFIESPEYRHRFGP